MMVSVLVHRRFHLDYTKAVDVVSWEELECLSKALGIPHTVLTGLCAKLVSPDAPGIPVEQFHEVHTTKDFQEVMNFSYNLHSYEWNSEVIKVSVYIITRRGLTFDQLRTVRAAYAFYEEADTKGMRLVERTLIRCLKMCNRVISPRKMMHRIKHMQDRFEVPGRIQLAEFMELVLWCDLYTAWSARVKQWELAEGKDEKLMWLLNEFYDFLHHQDAKLEHLLDRQYVREEWSFKKEKLNVSSRFHEPPVSPELRLKQTRRQRRAYLPIREALRQSEFDVRRGAAGGYYHERRPATAPHFLGRLHAKRAAMTAATESGGDGDSKQRPRSAKELMAAHFCDDAARPPRRDEEEPSESAQPAPKVARPRTAPFVREEEQRRVEEMIDAIQFDQSTVDVRYDNYMREDLEYLRPGFWRRASRRSAENCDPSAGPQERRRVYVPQRPSKAFVGRLASQRSGQPLPVHGSACDARYRGWEPSADNTRHGPQRVLVSPSFERCGTGAMLSRLRRTDADVLRKLHGEAVQIRISRKERRRLHLPATELMAPSKGKVECQRTTAVSVRPQTANVGGRVGIERQMVSRRPFSSRTARKSEQEEKEEKDEGEEKSDQKSQEIRELRAILQEGLSSRRTGKVVSPTPSPDGDRSVLVTISEEVL